MAKNIIEILILAKNEASKAFKEAGKDATTLEKATKAVKAALVSVAFAYGAREIYDFAMEARQAGVELENARNKLTQTAGGAEQYAATIAAAKEATRGMTSETQLANGAFVLMQMGLAKSTTEAAQLANAGQVLSAAFESQGASVELFNRLLANGSAVLLDNFGISQAQVKARQAEIEATGVAAEQEARLMAIRELAIAKATELGSTLSGAAVSAKQNAAAYADMMAALGELELKFGTATPIITDFYRFVESSAEGWSFAIEQMQAMGNNLDWVSQKFDIISAAAMGAIEAINPILMLPEAISSLEGPLTGLVSGFINVERGADVTARAAEKMGINVDELSSKIISGQLSAADWGNALKEAGAEIDAERQAAQKAGSAAAAAVPAIDANSAALMGNKAAADAAAAGQKNYKNALGGTRALTAGESAAAAAKQLEIDKAKELYDAEQAVELARARARESANVSANKAIAEQNALPAADTIPDYGTAIKDSIDNSKTDIENAITGAVQGAYDKLASVAPKWLPGGGQEANQDADFGARMAALAEGGLSESNMAWVDQFKQQAGGNPLYAALLQSIEQSDGAAVAQQATALMTNNLIDVMATGALEAYKTSLQQKDFASAVEEVVNQQLGQAPITEGAGVAVTPEDVTSAQTDIQTALNNTATAASGIKTSAESAINAAITATDKWINRVNELNRILGITDGYLQNVKKNMDNVAPATTTPGKSVGGMTPL